MFTIKPWTYTTLNSYQIATTCVKTDYEQDQRVPSSLNFNFYNLEFSYALHFTKIPLVITQFSQTAKSLHYYRKCYQRCYNTLHTICDILYKLKNSKDILTFLHTHRQYDLDKTLKLSTQKQYFQNQQKIQYKEILYKS